MSRHSWPLEWAQMAVSRRTSVDAERMYELLSRTFHCARCGRNDLPLALFFEHNQSCSFESAVSGSSLDMVDEIRDLLDKIEQKDERIEKLEMACRDGLNTIHWFEGWLNNRTSPLNYDDSACKNCGTFKAKHLSSQCENYEPSDYSVSYTARDVALMKISIAKALGPSGIGYHEDKYRFLFSPKEARCTKCQGLFDIQHLTEKVCKWCGAHSNDVCGKILP